jgi:predicted DNA binding protein
MSYVWVHGDSLDQVEAAIRSSEQVRSLTQLNCTDGRALYRISWEDKARSLVTGIAETNATVLEARGNEDWFFHIRFDSRRELMEFREFCRHHGIVIELGRVYTLGNQGTIFDFELTDSQRKTLFQAVRDGYFEVPRRTTLDEVGEKLGITGQSASENLRRGAGKVLKQVLMDPSGANP